MTKLTPKQEKFCCRYIETGNASEAYRYAYNTSRMKSDSVNRKAKELLDHVKISARISELQDELKQVHDIKKDRIMYELRAIMEAKITDYLELNQVPIHTGKMDDDGNEIIVMSSALVFKDFSKLTEMQVRAIESMKDTKYGIELKLHGKSWSIERICKMLGYEAPKKLDVKSGDKEIGGYVLVLPSNGREVEIKKDQ
jgi:phage terminase small subunit